MLSASTLGVSVSARVSGSSEKLPLVRLAPFLQAAQPSFEKTENKRLTGEQGKKVLERNLFLQEAQWLVVKQTAVLLFPC